MSTKIILIRHGQTKANAQRKYIGSTDARLDATGRRQARRLGQRLAQIKIDCVYASSALRAKEFARIVFSGRRIRLAAGLREIHFGIFEGLNHEELMKRYRAVYCRWLKHKFAAPVPGAEPLADFRKRVFRELNTIAGRHPGKTVAIVTHAGPIRMIIKRIPALGSMQLIEFSRNKARFLNHG